MSEALLDVRNLRTCFHMEEGSIAAVDGVSLHVMPGEAVGLVGESGCGKSVTALSVMRLIYPPGKIEEGEVIFKGKNLLKISEPEMRKIRGNEISMIFQETMTSLNPVFTVGNQIAEAIELHQGKGKKAALEEAVRMLRAVQIPDPEKRIYDYPHQMSGGMRQRVMIAMALSCNPSLLIADEPSTALDVTIQAQILDIIAKLQEEFGLSVILITHDLGVIAETVTRVIVMYTGRIVEEGSVKEIFKDPKHPYTQGLLQSVPKMHKEMEEGKRERLDTIEGIVPDLLNLPKGCHFAPRCPRVMDICREQELVEKEISPGRKVLCFLY